MMPLRIKIVFHYGSEGVSLILLTLSLSFFASPDIEKLSDHNGAKILVSAGFLSLLSLLILLGAVDHYKTEQVVLLYILLLLIGTLHRMWLTPVFSDVTYLVTDKKAGQLGIFEPIKGTYA